METNRREFLIGSAALVGAVITGDGISSMVGSKGSVAEAAGSDATYEIYALKYAGPFTGKLAMLLWMEGWDKEVDRNYYLWAIKGGGEIIVVDTGCGVTLANQRKLPGFENPVEVLARIGADKTNVKRVIITHIHFDHVGGLEMFPEAFPNAEFYVQEKEYDFWMKNPIAKRPPFAKLRDEVANKALETLDRTKRLHQLAGDTRIMPGIEALLAPGHTVGLQAVAVNTARGTAIVASDCAHIHKSFVDDTPSCLITDMIAWMESYDKLRAKASSIDLIFPGHDVKMLSHYPKVAENVTRLV
jgi:glyoxylase-like metal-dependent hydrolase (beta-lactamase superfamily II)